jgi:hypothetical protein
MSEGSQTCSQLIHTRFVIFLASGLETRNQVRKRQEKNEFIFNYDQKNFLDWEMKHACRCENRNSASKKIAQPKPPAFKIAAANRLVAIVCASRVDRIGLCAKFPVSPGEGQTLSKL